VAFEEMVGQEKIIHILKNALYYNQIAHAYLFEGLEGLGKREAALEFAKSICCQEQKTKYCGKCSSCIKITNNNHPDIKWFEGTSSSIKIEDVRNIKRSIQMKPYLGDKSIYIICNAEKMTIQAQNALLKTLEEPPEHVVIILLVSNVQSVLPTIKSRCQILKFQQAALKEIQRYLVEKMGLPVEKANVITAFSNGIIGKAKQILENDAFIRRRETVLELTNFLFIENTFQILNRADYFNEEKDFIEEMLDLLMSWYRDILIYQNTHNTKLLMNTDKEEMILLQSNKLSIQKVKHIIEIIENAKNNLKHNVNYSLNLEVMLINIEEVVKQ
jgi:DNA polymerase III subunit delta'